MYKTCTSVLMLMVSLDSAAYYTEQSKIYATDGTQIIINGVSWSGFQDTNVLQGLQSNSFYGISASSPKRDYGMMDVLASSAAMPPSAGDFPLFKTVRIPIQPGVLYDDTGKVDLNTSLSDVNHPTQGNGIFCKTWQTTWIGCQTSVSPKDAFWTVLGEMKKQKLAVMVDMHHRYGYGDAMRDGTVYDMDQYQKDLTLRDRHIFLNLAKIRKIFDNILNNNAFHPVFYSQNYSIT